MAVLENRKIQPDLVRGAAVETLGYLQAERAFSLLAVTVQDPTEELGVRLRALEGISKFDTPLINPQVDEVTLNCFRDKTNPEELRYEVVGMMGELSVPGSYEILVDTLKNHIESDHIRANAAYALGIFGENAALQPLLDATSDPDEEVRYWATNGLGHLELNEAVPRLIEILGQDEDDDVRIAAAYSLGVIKDPRGFEPLIAALKDKKWNIRSWVIASLYDFGDIRAVSALQKMLYDKSTRVAEWAAFMLNGFPGTNVAADLEVILGNLKGQGKDSLRRRKVLEKALERVKEVNENQANSGEQTQADEEN
jgi:HEAT repeat protein